MNPTKNKTTVGELFEKKLILRGPVSAPIGPMLFNIGRCYLASADVI
jgi:hypothetical protein